MSSTSFPDLPDLEYIKGSARVADVLKTGGVIEGWATWCPPCKVAIPHLTEIAKAHPAVPFIGISSEPFGTAKRFVDKMGEQMDYTVAVDPDGAAQAAFASAGMQGIPFAVVIDASGSVVYTGHPMEPAFEAAVAEISTQCQLAQVKSAKLEAVAGKSRDEITAMSVKELKATILALGVSHVGCTEKSELVDLIMDNLPTAS